jgi:hypothetical protein
VTRELYEARGTIVVTPTLAELHLANEQGESLVSRRVCNCADGLILCRARYAEAEQMAKLIAKALNFYVATYSKESS